MPILSICKTKGCSTHKIIWMQLWYIHKKKKREMLKGFCSKNAINELKQSYVCTRKEKPYTDIRISDIKKRQS